MAKQWHLLEKLDHKALKKLQAEREKQKQLELEKEARTRKMIIGGIVFACIIVAVAFAVFANHRSNARKAEEKREELKISSVIAKEGAPTYRTLGIWETIPDNALVKVECGYRTAENESVTVQLQLENQIKLLQNSEMLVSLPQIATDEDKVVSESLELVNGEITVIITLDGRDLLSIKVGDLVITGKSGLFKVIYNQDKEQGEVVVKNGLVEVTGRGKTIKVTGFYKVTFDQRKLSKPTQASVIQYDWR